MSQIFDVLVVSVKVKVKFMLSLLGGGYGEAPWRFLGDLCRLEAEMEALDDCPDDSDDESMAIAQLLLRQQCYRINDGAFAAFADSIRRRRMLSLLANAGSTRHGIDRMRRLQACLLSRMGEPMRRDDLITIDAEDILSSRVSHAAP